MRDQGNLELALETRKKETEKERSVTNGHFFEHLVLAYTMDLINDLGLIR